MTSAIYSRLRRRCYDDPQNFEELFYVSLHTGNSGTSKDLKLPTNLAISHTNVPGELENFSLFLKTVSGPEYMPLMADRFCCLPVVFFSRYSVKVRVPILFLIRSIYSSRNPAEENRVLQYIDFLGPSIFLKEVLLYSFQNFRSGFSRPQLRMSYV